MLIKTHLAIIALAILFFINSVAYKLTFIITALLVTFLPDIDSYYSTLGHHKIFRPVQFLSKHRGVLHSFTFCILLSIIFAFFLPVIAFPFFLAYSLHLLGDSFTQDGIRPFWPWKKGISGRIKTGGIIETSIFVIFLILDAAVLVWIFG